MSGQPGPVHLTLREWQTCSPDHQDGKALRGRRLADAARPTAQALARAGKVIVRELADGLEVQTRSHVGRIALGDLTVTIQPKLAGGHLLRLLRYAYDLRNLALYEDADFSTSGELLQDLLVAQLAAEVRELLGRGLRRAYRRRSDEISTPRGRIDVERLAARGGLTRASLPCRVHDRSHDWLLNRALAAGLGVAAGCAADADLRATVRSLARRLPDEIAPARPSAALFADARRSIDRLSAAYAPALRLIEILYGGERLALEDAGGEVTVRGFLFDMNRFFQALLGRFLREGLPGWDVREEHALREMFRYSPTENPRGRRAPRPRPDYAIMRGGGVVALLDAKYRDLWELRLPREMLYQLALYAISQPPGFEAVILYPALAPAACDARIEVREPVLGHARAHVVLRPVRLDALHDAIERGPAAREALARQLAFGARAPA